MREKKLYTLGTGLRSQEDFIEIIDSYEIEAVIDVRAFPQSRLSHFKRVNLEKFLRKQLIEYHYLGRELGGFRKGGYENYTQTSEFKSGIDVLETIARKKKCVIICAERFPWRCHRRFIARALQQRGWQIEHIIDKGKIWIPKSKPVSLLTSEPEM
jgi:uncharacterized protein (DUF488 family)